LTRSLHGDDQPGGRAQKNKPTTAISKSTIEQPMIVSRSEWIEARKKLLAKEKALTRQHDPSSTLTTA
jgi:Bacterial protein of unknown function (DUF899)